ncbi:MAG: hypothetical protein ACWA5X_12345 [bacterium]
MSKKLVSKHGWKSLVSGAVCAGGLMFSGGASAFTVYVSWDGDSVADTPNVVNVAQNTDFGGAVFVDTQGQFTKGYGVSLDFDDASNITYVGDSPNTGTFPVVSVNNGSGTDPVEFSAANLFGQTSGVVKLFDFTLNSGSTAGLFNLGLADIAGDQWVDSASTVYDSQVVFQNTQINVTTPVPVPAGFILLGSGLVALSRMKKKA